MNKAYRIVWNKSMDCWTVASEFATSKGSNAKKSAMHCISNDLQMPCHLAVMY